MPTQCIYLSTHAVWTIRITDYIMQYENLSTTASVQTWRQKRRQKLMGNWFLWHTVGRPTHAFYLLDSSSLTSPLPLLSFKQFPKLFLVNIIFIKLTNHISDYIQGLCQHLPCLWCLESLDSASCFQLIMSPSSLASRKSIWQCWKYKTSVKAETLAEPACLWDFLREEIEKGLRNPPNLNPTPNCWKFFRLRLSYSH